LLAVDAGGHAAWFPAAFLTKVRGRSHVVQTVLDIWIVNHRHR